MNRLFNTQLLLKMTWISGVTKYFLSVIGSSSNQFYFKSVLYFVLCKMKLTMYNSYVNDFYITYILKIQYPKHLLLFGASSCFKSDVALIYSSLAYMSSTSDIV